MKKNARRRPRLTNALWLALPTRSGRKRSRRRSAYARSLKGNSRESSSWLRDTKAMEIAFNSYVGTTP